MKTRTITSGIRKKFRMAPLIGKIIVYFVLPNLQYFRNEIVFKFMWQMNIKPQLVKCQPVNQNGIQAFIKSHLIFIIQRIFWNMKVWISCWNCEIMKEKKIHVPRYVILFWMMMDRKNIKLHERCSTLNTIMLVKLWI